MLVFMGLYHVSSTAWYCFNNSTCLSNARCVSKRTDTSSHFSMVWSRFHSSFVQAPPLQNSNGNATSLAVKLPFILETIQGMVTVLWITDSKSYIDDQSVSISMTLQSW